MAVIQIAVPAASTRRVLGAWIGALVVTTAAAWLAVVGAQGLARSRDLVAGVEAAPGRMVGPAVVAVVILVFMAERRWPAVRRPVLARAHVVDAAYLLLFAAVVAPLVTLVDTGFALTIERHAHFLLLGRLPLAPRVLVVGLILVGMDAMNWLAHVANHRSSALWRFHALHHSQEDMSVFTTFRTHPLTHASYLVAILPALVLGASGTVPSAALIAYSCLVTLPHANLGWRYGVVGKILVSPAYHRLHHARSPVDGRLAVNFGFVLVVWDRLAGRAVYPAGEPVLTGIGGRPVPIEQSVGGWRLAQVMGAQITQPFAMRSATDGQP